MRDRLKLIDLYLGRNTLQGFVLVLSVLVVLFSFLELLIQINDVGKGAYRLQDAFLFVGMTIPRRMVDLMPVAALLGSIVALGLLADHQELTAMQAAGISVQRIAFSVLGTSVILMAAALFMAEFVAPPLDQAARIQRSRAVYGKPIVMSKEGFWMRHGRSFVNVGRALPGDRAADIEVYEMDEAGRLIRFIAAREAAIQGNQDWVLSGVQAKRFAGEAVSTIPVEEFVLKGFLTPAQVSILELPADSLSLSDLWGYIQSLRERGQNHQAYSLAFWQKTCLPVTTGIMVLLSLSFVFGSTRIRNAGQRIFTGMLVGILFYLSNQILAHLGLILDLPPLPTTLVPVSVVLVVALRLLRRTF
jgi:lipopolysaccharide export system permease protein